jgi:hypothetical protein
MQQSDMDQAKAYVGALLILEAFAELRAIRKILASTPR